MKDYFANLTNPFKVDKPLNPLTERHTKQNTQCPIYLSKEICYNSLVTESNEEEIEKMSYVGVITSENGAVAFSDSRDTRIQTNGKIISFEDNIQKVFKSDMFLIAACGLNEYIINGKKHPLSELINERLSSFKGNHRQFLASIHKDLIEQINKRPFADSNYEFVVAYKVKSTLNESCEYLIDVCIIDAEGLKFDNTHSESSFYVGGQVSYGIQSVKSTYNWSLEHLEEFARNAVNFAITVSGNFPATDTVGGPIQIETLK